MITNLDTIANFKDGWHKGEGKSFSINLINKCKWLYNNLGIKPAIFPNLDGTIQFEYIVNDIYLEFKISENLIEVFTIDNEKESMLDFNMPNNEVEGMNQLINELYDKVE